MNNAIVSRRSVLGAMVVGTSISVKGVIVPATQTIPKTRIGINESDASIYGFSDPWRDWSL